MTRAIKLFGVVFFTFFLTYCQEGPSSRSARRFGLVNPATQAPQTQPGKAFTSRLSPMMPLNFLQAFQPQESLNPPVTESPIDLIDHSQTVDASAVCLGTGGVDSDNDGLTDDCDLEHYPLTYNGWLVSGRYFNSKDTRLALTAEENAEWKRDVAERGGIGFGNISTHAQRLVKKFSALKKLSQSDVTPLKTIFYNYSEEPIRISDNFKSYERSRSFQAAHPEAQFIGLASGDGDESIPYSSKKPATNVAGLTAFGKDTDSYREQGRFKMLVYETNVVIPKNSESLQVTIGHLSNDNFMMPPKTGMYYVINNGDSILLQNEMLSDKGYEFSGSRFGTIYRDSGCVTAHLIVVYITDGSNDRRGQPILPEIIAFRENEKSKWFIPSQEYYSIQPHGGVECQQGFGVNDIKDEKTFLATSTNITRHVPGVVDFNTSLGIPGVANPYRMLDADSESIDLIKDAAAEKPVKDMDLYRLSEYEKALVQINRAALSPEDQKWLDEENQKIDDQKIVLKQGKEIGDQFGQLAQLNQKLATLDPSSPDYASTAAKIDELLKNLGAANLTEAQKTELGAQTKAYNDRKAALAAPVQPVTPENTAKKIGVIHTVDSGSITLKAADLVALRDLGFAFEDENGKTFVPGSDSNNDRKITNDELIEVLNQLQQRLDDNDFKTASGQGPQSLQRVLDALRSGGADPKIIDAFESKNADKLFTKWTPEQIEYLKSLDSDASKVKPGIQGSLDVWSKGFKNPREEEKAKEEALGKIEKKLLDPATLKDYTAEERVADAEKLKGTGLINPERYLALRLNMAKLSNLESADFSFKSTKTSVGKDGSGNEVLRDVITLEGAIIRFEVGSNKIQFGSQQLLKRVAKEVQTYKALTGKSDVYVLLKAYTDPSGPDATNLKLSECRAQAVKDFFAGKINIDRCDGKGKVVGTFTVDDAAHIDDAQKLPETSIKALGLGEDKSKGEKVNKAVAEKLRRVEIFLSDKPF